MTIKTKPKEWFDNNKMSNANYTIQIGNRLYVSDSNDIWVVVEIIEGYNIEDHGSIFIKKESYTSNYTNIYDDPEFNNNYKSYVHFGWQRLFRIINLIPPTPYKNWQEWLNSEEGKRVVGV